MNSTPSFFRAHAKAIIATLVVVVGVLGYGWYRVGFTFELSRFFAAEQAVPTDTPLAQSGCNLVGTTCDGNYIFSHYSNCNGSRGIDCSLQGRVCQSADDPARITAQCVSEGGIDPTVTVTTGPGTTVCSGALETHTDSQTNVTFCIKSSTFNRGNLCTTASSGVRTHVVGIINNSPYNGYFRSAGFYDPVPGCGATQAQNFGFGPTGDVNIPAGGSGVVTFTYDPADIDCGRVQLDSCFFGDGYGCMDKDQWNILGLVVNSNKVCVTATPTITVTTTPTITVTTTPTTTVTTTTPPALSCASEQAAVETGQLAYFGATGGTGVYTWTAPTGAPATGSGQRFGSAYTTAGRKMVVVTSGNDQAVCSVEVNPAASFSCSPATQTTSSGTAVTINAVGGTAPYAWTAAGGTAGPGSQNGSLFSVSYANTGNDPVTHDVVVRDAANRQATCRVVVNGQSTQTFSCAPATQTILSGATATFAATGGTLPYTWIAPNGTNGSSTQSGLGYSAVFTNGSTAMATYDVTVRDAASREALCRVSVPGQSNSAPAIGLIKQVRNITQNTSEVETVTANPGDTVEFVLRVSSNGSATATAVTVRDTLPAGLTYLSGTTTIDGSTAADGIVGSGVALGDMVPGRTIVVRFRAGVAASGFFSPGTTMLTNTAYARGNNVAEVSDVAFVQVTVGGGGGTISLSLTKLGRNVSRGATGEFTSVAASPAELIEFIVRVRNTSSSRVNNILVRDVAPAEVIIDLGSIRVNGIPQSGVPLVNQGIAIGSLEPGQEAVITFNGHVVPAAQLPTGTITVINTAYATADGIGTLTAQLPIIITRGSGVVTDVPTGPGESTLLALIVSAIVTLLYVGYTSTDSFRRHEVQQLAHKARSETDTFNFRP